MIIFLLVRTNAGYQAAGSWKAGQPIPERSFIDRLKTRRAIAFYIIIGVFLRIYDDR